MPPLDLQHDTCTLNTATYMGEIDGHTYAYYMAITVKGEHYLLQATPTKAMQPPPPDS